MAHDPLHLLCIVAGGLWVLVALTVFPRGNRRTQPEMAFSVFAALLGTWALIDSWLIQTTAPATASVIVRTLGATSSFSALFLFYFAKWATRGRRSTDVWLVLPIAAAIALNWMSLAGIAIEPWGPRAIRIVPLYAAWFLIILAYALASFALLLPGLRVLLQEDRALGLRAVSVLVATVMATALAIQTNIAMGTGGSLAISRLSSLLVIPGIVVLLPSLLVPVPRWRVARALRRLVLSFDREILAAAVVKDDGSVLGLAMQKPKDAAQADLPVAMVAVQQSLQISPRGPSGRASSVCDGDVTFIVRSGSGVTLVVAVGGLDHDFLRRAVDDMFVLIDTVPYLLSSARQGSIPAMTAIVAVLKAFIAGAI